MGYSFKQLRGRKAIFDKRKLGQLEITVHIEDEDDGKILSEGELHFIHSFHQGSVSYLYIRNELLGKVINDNKVLIFKIKKGSDYLK